MKTITFMADTVQVKSGYKLDNSGQVVFVVGEYMLDNIKELVSIVDKNLKVTVEVETTK